ncbi:MAG: type II toxin-antitoxin system Phd/YefM family antitoxin [Spirochaetales bacterium]|mgnify:CR=1 FL=1|nr:type II toxin-antitoxin system Phd/YefM family antitoxin [Spirochaetales bacterium]MBP7263885.1 type II toxin-antitoxin system Phd/YefM family antitoxin [Spirochaetia bacterium]
MVTEMTITETRKKITSLEKELGFDDTISITNHGREVFALMKWDTYESIHETLEILTDEDLLRDLKKGLRQLQEKKLVDLEDFKKSL